MAPTLRRRLLRLLAVGAVAVSGCTGPAAGTAGRAAGRSETASSPSVAAVTYDWSRIAAGALDLGGGATSTLSAVLAPQQAGADWLMAGTRVSAAGVTTATAWSSPDGVRWTARALPGFDGRALAATAWGARTIIVGSVRSQGRQQAAVWISPGRGGAFAPVAPQPTLAPAPGTTLVPSGSATMDVVSAGAQGVFAGGSVSGRQAMWYSTDGSDWVRVAGAERVLDAAAGALVTTMLVTPSAVLAAGTVQDGTHTDAAVWSSPDGLSWQRLGAAGGAFAGAGDHRIDGLAPGPSGSLVAVGALRSGPAWLPASWISPNGATWSQPSEALPTQTRPQPVRGGTVVRAVTASGSALVAVGGSSTAQRVWTSTDGQNWTETPLPANVADASDWSADLVATSGSTTLVVDRTPGRPRVLVRLASSWREVSAPPSTFGPVAPVATPAALVADGPRLLLAVDVYRPGQTIGAATSSAVVLSSGDGTRWQRVSADGALTGGWIDSMLVVGGSLVAVGRSTTPTGGSAATIWTSPSGRSWSVAAVFGSTSPAPGAAATVASLGSTVVAAGTSPAAPAAAVDAPPLAQAWSTTGSPWAATGTLDAVASVGAEAALGSCSNGPTLVVVGDSARRGIPMGPTRLPARPGATTTTLAVAGSPAGPYGQASDGTIAQAWATTNGTSWTPGTASPISGAGGHEAMDGCAGLGSGFIAWGETPGPGDGAVPAIWASTDGVAWTLESLPTLGLAGTAPLTALAQAGTDWVAVSAGNLAATADPGDPGAAVDDPVRPMAAPPEASGPDGTAGVWSSADAGQTWTRDPTTGAPWAASATLSTDLVHLLGQTVVVVGEVDGRLAAWVGDPATA